jgi:small-conductance mechanosensitive channel
VDYIYILSTTVFFIFAAILLKKLVDQTEKRKIKKLEKRKNFDAVDTDSPIDDPFDEAMERGLSNIEMRFTFIKRMLYPALFTMWAAVTFVPSLGNIPKIYTSLFVGAMTVVIGVAARPFIENIFAGLTISFSNSLRVGDTVEVDGVYGTVESIDLTHSTIKVWDWRRYMVPNTRLIQKDFLNYSLHDKYIWAKIEFTVARTTNLERVEALALKAARDSKYFDRNLFESPSFWVMGLKDNYAECWLAAWAKSPVVAWDLKNDLRIRINHLLNQEGIKSCNKIYHVEDHHS